ncbi:diacylglycerol/lipid kinase family protein [Halegenticoccus tardaugens]|uniref:diacylglycerol/lipid kinase family protein n=1 Tax=Halegenticoccus tardaugens TaxID=2071624 RepID=UPI00100A3336|nr:diacylglycerol kinase family protein [Halegenticoccus tardaugens]
MRRDLRSSGDARARGTAADGGRAESADRVVVLNPVSGSADHAETVRELAAEHGFSVRETKEEGDGIRFAAEAVDAGAEFVLAAGGDGTINEVLAGIDRGGGVEDVTFGVVPTGTGNNFAANVGVEGVEHAFEVAESGERRRIDLGVARATADGEETSRPFVNSCVCGLTAEASGATEPDSKSRFGVVAYVLTTLRTIADFEPIQLRIEPEPGPETGASERSRGGGGDRGDDRSGDPSDRVVADAAAADDEPWTGEALCVLIGNGRRFPAEGRTQADVEDGLFDVTIIEDRPAVDLAGQAAVQRLFGGETENITRLKTPALSLDVRNDDPIRFSLDGEMLSTDRLVVETRPNVLELCVGEAYEPHPE